MNAKKPDNERSDKHISGYIRTIHPLTQCSFLFRESFFAHFPLLLPFFITNAQAPARCRMGSRRPFITICYNGLTSEVLLCRLTQNLLRCGYEFFCCSCCICISITQILNNGLACASISPLPEGSGSSIGVAILDTSAI